MPSQAHHARIQAISFAAIGLLLAAGASAGDRRNLSTDCEIAVARSAAPERLREDASVYVLADGAYHKAVDGSGPLTCVVERNHRDSLIPQCMDRGGVDSVLPAIIFRSLLAVDGASAGDIEAASIEKTASGEFAPLPAPGLSYMMSNYNYIFVRSANAVRKVPSHVMFYGPNISNSDIGGSFESMVTNPGTPFVFSEGIHGYMVVYTQEHASADEVVASCGRELGDIPPDFDPFPAS